MNVPIKLIEGGKIPEYKTKGSSGADCYARLNEPISICPGETTAIPLGFCVEIPEGFEMQIRPRSGLSREGQLVILGTIDSDYRGEVAAIVHNDSHEHFNVSNGLRIAQAVVAPVTKVGFYLVDELSNTERGEGGFGHTGK